MIIRSPVHLKLWQNDEVGVTIRISILVHFQNLDIRCQNCYRFKACIQNWLLLGLAFLHIQGYISYTQNAIYLFIYIVDVPLLIRHLGNLGLPDDVIDLIKVWLSERSIFICQRKSVIIRRAWVKARLKPGHIQSQMQKTISTIINPTSLIYFSSNLMHKSN